MTVVNREVNANPLQGLRRQLYLNSYSLWRVLTYCSLDGDAPLWGEEAHGPVIRGLKLHPLLRDLAQLGQRHHLCRVRTN